MISYAIKEVTAEYTYVVFTNAAGDSVGQMFPDSPTEAEIMIRGAEVLKETKPATIAELRERKRDAINSGRYAVLTGGFTWRGYRIDSDEVARANISGEALAAFMGEPFPVNYTWRTADNINVPVTAADVIDLARTLRLAILKAYSDSWTAKAAVDVATSEAELDAIPTK